MSRVGAAYAPIDEAKPAHSLWRSIVPARIACSIHSVPPHGDATSALASGWSKPDVHMSVKTWSYLASGGEMTGSGA